MLVLLVLLAGLAAPVGASDEGRERPPAARDKKGCDTTASLSAETLSRLCREAMDPNVVTRIRALLRLRTAMPSEVRRRGLDVDDVRAMLTSRSRLTRVSAAVLLAAWRVYPERALPILVGAARRRPPRPPRRVDVLFGRPEIRTRSPARTPPDPDLCAVAALVSWGGRAESAVLREALQADPGLRTGWVACLGHMNAVRSLRELANSSDPATRRLATVCLVDDRDSFDRIVPVLVEWFDSESRWQDVARRAAVRMGGRVLPRLLQAFVKRMRSDRGTPRWPLRGVTRGIGPLALPWLWVAADSKDPWVALMARRLIGVLSK